MKLWVPLLGLLVSMPVLGEISFAQLSQLVDNPQQHQGRFQQEKYISSVDASLASSGEFAYRRGESIRWHIQQPIETELLLTPAGISSNGQSGLLLQLEGNDNPVAKVMGEFLFALLTSDWNALSVLFELSGEVSAERWQATLVPRDGSLAQVFDRIEISGAGLLEKVVMHESSGDRTTIMLD